MRHVAVAWRAHRRLERLPCYRNLQQGLQHAPFELGRVPLEEGEMPVGLYENWPRSRDEAVLFTDDGLYVYHENRWVKTRYRDILQVDFAGGKQSDVDALSLMLSDGGSLIVPFRGRNEGIRYVASVATFLIVVIGDVHKAGSGGAP